MMNVSTFTGRSGSLGTIPQNFRDSTKINMPDIPKRTNATLGIFSMNLVW